ncbi:MAG TPA: hypothetical protein VMM37_05185 [Bacteroidota bacterium]|nr:hypothetical protein [Bacteroidota bacterium]
MKKVLKRIGIIGGPLVVILFLAFLYLMPPFYLVPPEGFVKENSAQGPDLSKIKDPAERMLAERGRYIVLRTDCSGCHTPVGGQGPKWDEYLAGGTRGVFGEDHLQTFCRNLTPDPKTGLKRRTNDEVLRVLRTGILPEGRPAFWRRMPWPFLSRLTEEDRYAVLVYLRNLTPVYHEIKEPSAGPAPDDSTVLELGYGADEAGHQQTK